MEETVCVSVLRLWQAVCSENGKPGNRHQPLLMHHHSEGSGHGGGGRYDHDRSPEGQVPESAHLDLPLKKHLDQKQGLATS